MAEETVIKVAHWPEIKAHHQHTLEAAYASMDQAADEMTLWRLQGRAKVLRELLNLPDTLSVIENV